MFGAYAAHFEIRFQKKHHLNRYCLLTVVQRERCVDECVKLVGGGGGRYLEQAEKHVALVSTRHEVLGLKQKRVGHCQRRPTPADELRDVVSRLERAWLRRPVVR